MIRYALAAAVMVVGVTAAFAQDSVTARRSAMKAMAAPHYGTLGAMGQARQPYDQARVDAAFVALEALVPKVPTLFPADSNKGPDAGSDYYATPAAFQPQAKADIEAKVAAVSKTIADVKGTAKDVASLRAAFTAINNSCNACHSLYQARKS